MKLTITVTMGNDAMQTRRHAAAAVISALYRNPLRLDDPFRDGDDGVIMDENGNTVGTWQADAEPEDFPGIAAADADAYEAEIAADETDTRITP